MMFEMFSLNFQFVFIRYILWWYVGFQRNVQQIVCLFSNETEFDKILTTLVLTVENEHKQKKVLTYNMTLSGLKFSGDIV